MRLTQVSIVGKANTQQPPQGSLSTIFSLPFKFTGRAEERERKSTFQEPFEKKKPYAKNPIRGGPRSRSPRSIRTPFKKDPVQEGPHFEKELIREGTHLRRTPFEKDPIRQEPRSGRTLFGKNSVREKPRLGRTRSGRTPFGKNPI